MPPTCHKCQANADLELCEDDKIGMKWWCMECLERDNPLAAAEAPLAAALAHKFMRQQEWRKRLH